MKGVQSSLIPWVGKPLRIGCLRIPQGTSGGIQFFRKQLVWATLGRTKVGIAGDD